MVMRLDLVGTKLLPTESTIKESEGVLTGPEPRAVVFLVLHSTQYKLIPSCCVSGWAGKKLMAPEAECREGEAGRRDVLVRDYVPAILD